jgi:quercetin dioxygenase-like cupin family protein
VARPRRPAPAPSSSSRASGAPLQECRPPDGAHARLEPAGWTGPVLQSDLQSRRRRLHRRSSIRPPGPVPIDRTLRLAHQKSRSRSSATSPKAEERRGRGLSERKTRDDTISAADGVPVRGFPGHGGVLLRAGTAGTCPPAVLTLTTSGIPKSDTHEVRILTAALPPGTASTWHTHPAPPFVYVVEGEVVIESEARPPIEVQAGHTIMDPTDEVIRAVNRGTVPTRMPFFRRRAAHAVPQGSPALISEVSGPISSQTFRRRAKRDLHACRPVLRVLRIQRWVHRASGEAHQPAHLRRDERLLVEVREHNALLEQA